MRVLHVNADDSKGGAARAAYCLHKGLMHVGHDSAMFVFRRRSNDPAVIALKPSSDLPGRLYRLVHRNILKAARYRYRHSRPDGSEVFSDHRSEYGRVLAKQLPSADIINLHWVAGLLDHQAFFSGVPLHTPLVWTLHDMNPFTGGCHYDDGCRKYLTGCGACPQLGSDDPHDLSRRIWQRKREIFGQIDPSRLHIVTPSRWLYKEAKRSPLLGRFPICVIPNGVDTIVFAPRDRGISRAVLEVPQNGKLVMFAADLAENRRKGFALLKEMLAKVDSATGLYLISVGRTKPTMSSRIPHIYLGYINANGLLSLVYSAADLFLIPSLQDNLPNTVLESMACGTPVVGFEVGGIPDMVRPGVTGLLAPPEDVGALRNVTLDLLEDKTRRKEMSANCREIAVKEFSLAVQARSYADLYERILEENSS